MYLKPGKKESLYIKRGEFMSFDFTPEETDNALFLREVLHMNNEELINSYKEKMVCRGEGGDLCFNIQMPIDILRTVSGQRNLQLPTVPEDHRIHGHIKQVDTPDSKSLEGYGFDRYDHTLYIKYRSNGKVYPFFKVDTIRFEQFRDSESLGKEVAKLRKEYAETKE